ncbi:hypothetical protein PJ900_08855 [Tistrella mobilis]|uniref:hypothetical protein n=1 Tax=Tistrella mobilis TaxID=171437 RepID=UPI0018D3FF6D|nr:hypothetical protein [Tistrella mobilis]
MSGDSGVKLQRLGRSDARMTDESAASGPAGDRLADDSVLATDVAAFYSIMGRLMRFRWLLVAGAILGIVLAVLIKIYGLPEYTARVQLMPSQTTSLAQGDLQAKSLFGGGFLMGQQPQSVPPYVQFQTALTSFELARQLAEDQQLLTKIFYKFWDPETGQWVAPDGPIAKLRDTLGLRPWAPPGAWELQRFMMARVEINAAAANGMMEISFEWEDPVFAQEFLRKMVAVADNMVRAADVRRAQQVEDFILSRLDEVTQIEQRTALTRLMIENERVLIFTAIEAPYAAAIFDGPIVEDRPSSPKLGKMILILAGGLVFLISLIVLLWPTRRRRAARRG